MDNTADPQTFKLYIQSQLNSKIFLITDSTEPIGVDSMEIDEKWTQVSVKSSACGIISGVTAYCWGSNGSGQLGNNTTVASLIPTIVDTSGLNGKTIKLINAGGGHTCAIASDDKAYCWGYNNKGQLGNNSTTNSLVPVAIDTSGTLKDKSISTIATGANSTCAITLGSSNQLHCWGYNGQGILGNDSTDDSLVPVRVVYPGS